MLRNMVNDINYAIVKFFYRYLTENKEMDLNIRDKWDSTPLYYACLCGHLELVIRRKSTVFLE